MADILDESRDTIDMLVENKYYSKLKVQRKAKSIVIGAVDMGSIKDFMKKVLNFTHLPKQQASTIEEAIDKVNTSFVRQVKKM